MRPKQCLETLLFPQDFIARSEVPYRYDAWTFQSVTSHIQELANDSTNDANMELRHILARLEQLRMELKDENLGILHSNWPSRWIRMLIFIEWFWGISTQFYKLRLWTGLQDYARSRLSLLIDRYFTKALRQLPTRRISSVNTARQSCSVINKEDYEDEDIILFSTAGTGKTRRILNTLGDRWGMYMMAPGVPKGDSSLGVFPGPCTFRSRAHPTLLLSSFFKNQLQIQYGFNCGSACRSSFARVT